MISRFLQRSDEQFMHSVLSAEQRTAALVQLRRRRAILGYVGLFVLGCFLLGAILEFISHRPLSAPPVFLWFMLLMLMLFQHDLTTQIRILEILQRGQFKASRGTAPTA